MDNLNITQTPQKTEKIKDNQKYLPYRLLEQIIKETDVSKKIIEETNSELWYETLTGLGKILFNNNVTYYGSVNNGVLDSGPKTQTCTIIFSDGTKYEGEIHNNKLTGKGKFIFPTKAIYTGEVLNGFRNGYGVYSSPEGVTYEGNWKKGLKHGKGKLIRKTMNYEGEWKMGYIEGEGRLKWENGNIYDGEFIANNINGNGYMIWYDRAEKYSGEWKENLQNGYGVHIWYEPKGETKILRNRYVGEWKNGLRNGYGIFFFSNGNKYEGYWKDNKKNGFGVYTFEDGSKYIGRFENDRLIDMENQIPDTKIDEILEKLNKENAEVLSPLKQYKEPIANSVIPQKQKRSSVQTTKPIAAMTPKVSLKKQSSSMTSPIITKRSEDLSILNGEKSSGKDSTNNNANSNQVNTLTQSASNVLPKMGVPFSQIKQRRTLNHFDPAINIDDLIYMDIAIDSDYPEIENVLLRSLTDIKKLYSNIIKMNIMDKDPDDPNSSRLIPKEIVSPEPSPKGHKHHKKPQQPVKVTPPKLFEISESIKTTDLSFCVCLKDIWRFLRDNGMISADVTICDFDRLFFTNEDNYYEAFHIPELLSTAKDIFNYLYDSISESKINFICKYKKYIEYYLFNQIKFNTNDITFTNNLLLSHSIHNKNLIILPRLFYEILIRISYLKYITDDATSLSSKLKNALGVLVPPKPKGKRGSIKMSISRLEQSFLNQQALQENKAKSHERNLVDEYVSLFENDIEVLFYTLYCLSNKRNKDKNDITISYDFFYSTVIKRSRVLSNLIPSKTKYVDMINYFHKDKIVLANEDLTQNSVKYFKYIEELLYNEMVSFEFCELLFFISRKYIATNKLSGIVSDYKKVIDIVSNVIVRTRKEGKCKLYYPELELHRLKQKLIDEREQKEKEEMERQKEVDRYTKEREYLNNEDQNVFIEEEENSDDEDDEDSDY